MMTEFSLCFNTLSYRFELIEVFIRNPSHFGQSSNRICHRLLNSLNFNFTASAQNDYPSFLNTHHLFVGII